MAQSDFLKIIEEQRKKKKEDRFSGTFLEYLALINENPDIVKTAHKRLYDCILEHGVDSIPDSDPRKQKIFDTLKKIKNEYQKKEFLIMHYNLKNTRLIWVKDQEALVNYVCKVEVGIDKQLDRSKHLDKFGLAFDIYAERKDSN